MISNNYDTKQSVAFAVPRYIDTQVLAGAAVTITVPTLVAGVTPAQCVLSATGNFYARFDGSAAAVPTGAITNGTGSMLNPTYFTVSPGQTFSVIGGAGVILTIAFYGA